LKFKYFAYGSNMWTPRLRERVPSAEPMGIASLAGYRLRFHKRSIDGSAKCNAFYTGNNANVVWGAVFDILQAEKANLDRAEGLSLKGYRDSSVSLTRPTGEQLAAVTYLAQSAALVGDLPTYSWYKEFVARGAVQHGLPGDYIAASINPAQAIQDPDHTREIRELSKLQVR
jgi:cation transport regulator ChaC